MRILYLVLFFILIGLFGSLESNFLSSLYILAISPLLDVGLVKIFSHSIGCLIKLQSFYKAKDTVNRTKWQPTDWEKIFTKSTFDRGLISSIYKEPKKLDSRQSNSHITNGGTELNRILN